MGIKEKSKNLINKLTARTNIKDEDGEYDFINDELQLINIAENFLNSYNIDILKKAKKNARFESGTDKVGFIYISQLEELLA